MFKTIAHLTALALLVTFTAKVHAKPCLKVTLTGTQGGPPVFQGQAGSGTLVQFGDDENNCSAVNLQFEGYFSHPYAF